MHKSILIPVALDHEAMVAGKIAVARRLLAEGGRITLLTVLERVTGYPAEFIDLKPEEQLKPKIRAKLVEVAAGASDIAVDVATGKAGVAISNYAKENGVDLIIVGSHHPTAQDYFLGSTASRVVRRAPCSVYVHRE